jgi:uncharacterized glyoxalase superfamily protein PhnB
VEVTRRVGYDAAMKLLKATPIFIVDRIEPALAFWERLGFQRTIEVPRGDRLGFVMLVADDREIMMQSRESVREDLAANDLDPSCALYCDVASLDEARAACEGARVVIADRQTAYGARELWVVDGSGTLVGFAEHAK